MRLPGWGWSGATGWPCLPTTASNGQKYFVAAAKAGIIAVPINFRLTGVEAQYIVENSGATAIICEDVLLPTIETVAAAESRYPGRPLHCDRGRQGRRWVAAIRGPDRGGRRPGAGRSGCAGDMLDVPDVHLRHHRQSQGRHPQPSRHGDAGADDRVELASRRDNALLVMPMCHANSLFLHGLSLLRCAVTVFSQRASIPRCACAPSARWASPSPRWCPRITP